MNGVTQLENLFKLLNKSREVFTMFIMGYPMSHKQINSYLDALARIKNDDNSGLARKARQIAEERKTEKRV